MEWESATPTSARLAGSHAFSGLHHRRNAHTAARRWCAITGHAPYGRAKAASCNIGASVLGGTPCSLNDLPRVPDDVAWAAVTRRSAITRSQTDRETIA